MRLLALVFITLASSAGGQIVRSLPRVEGLGTPDGIAIDRDGSIYIADYNQGAGTRVLRLDRDGRTSVFADGFKAPDGLAFDAAGRLYVSSFGGGTIHRVSREGRSEVFATGLDHPAGLAFGPDGTLYVAQFGNFNGTTVSRISPSGVVSTLAKGIPVPLGVAVGRDGSVFVSSYTTGTIYRIVKGRASKYASVRNTPLAQLQYLAFDPKGRLYVASLGHNRIYVVDERLRLHPYAGGLEGGFHNSSLATSRFHTPNSIAFMGDSLVITEYQSGRVRMIVPREFDNGAHHSLPRLEPDWLAIADDSATFTVIQTSATGHVDTLGTLDVVRRGMGDTLFIAREWSTKVLQSSDSLWMHRAAMLPMLSRSGPRDRRVETRYSVGRILMRGSGERLDYLSFGAFDAGSVDAIAAAMPWDKTTQASAAFFVPSMRGASKGEMNAKRIRDGEWEVDVVYPSAIVRVRVAEQGRRVQRVEYDYGGGRRLTLTRHP